MEVQRKLYVSAIACGILILNISGNTQGAVTLSPSGIASVCSGDQLELTCTLTDPGSSLLERNFTPTTTMTFRRAIEANSPSDQTSNIIINSTLFTISRSSAEDRLPLVSRLLINPVTIGLNGTMVNCTDALRTMETVSSIIIVMNQIQDIEVMLIDERYVIDGVTITLEWTERSSLYSYNINITPYLPFNFYTSTRVHLKVPYNTVYNISVVATPPVPCGQNNMFEVYYANCGDPTSKTDKTIGVHGYLHPAIEGTNVTFSCPPGLVLTGPNISTCMRNGEWEPAPKRMQCLARCNPPPLPTNGLVLPYTSTLEGAIVTYVCTCWKNHQREHYYECNITFTAACNEQGCWELDTDDICAEPRSALLSQDAIIAVASSIVIFIITSIIFFTFGYLCRHYRQKQEQTVPTPANRPTLGPVYENILPQQNTKQELELIAYSPLTTIVTKAKALYN